MTSGTDLTILVAVLAGVISFLSPCVLPLVPAYLGQLTAVAVAGTGPDGQRVSLTGQSADVLRLQSDGSWRFVIDNPWGTN